ARSSTVRGYPAAGSTQLALVAVLRPELLQESDRLEEWGDPLHRPVRHVRGCLALSAHGGHVRAFRDEVLDQLIVAASRGVVHGIVAIEITGIHVGAELLDEILHCRHPTIRRMAMRVRGVALAVADA